MLCFPGQRVRAIPGWRNPRLYLPVETGRQRWNQAALYQAFRTHARLYRFLLRLALVPTGRARTVGVTTSQIQQFVADHLPGATAAAVIVGTPGPAQKFVAVLWSPQGTLLGYVKYGETPAARARIRKECAILSGLPPDVGPRPLRLAPLGNGLGLLITPVPGTHVPARLPPHRGVVRLLQSLSTPAHLSVEAHPWLTAILNAPRLEHNIVRQWIDRLAGHDWPIVHQHGDCAPWNLLADGSGTLRAVDWEYGDLSGFPHIDLAYYFLQVAALIYRWPPGRATRAGIRYLSTHASLEVSPSAAEGILRLSAAHAYQQFLDDGQSPRDTLLRWYHRVWSGAA